MTFTSISNGLGSGVGVGEGEGVGAGGSADKIGSYYYNNVWHVGRWLGTTQRYDSNLEFTLYANGSPMSGSTSSNTYDTSSSSALSSIGSFAHTHFYDSREGYSWYYNAGYIGLA